MFSVPQQTVVSQHLQQQAPRPGQMYSQVPDLLNRGALQSGGGGDRGSLGSTGTEDSNGSSSSHPSTPHSFPSTPSSGFPPPPNSLMTSYPPPPRGHLTRGKFISIINFSRRPRMLNSNIFVIPPRTTKFGIDSVPEPPHY